MCRAHGAAPGLVPERLAPSCTAAQGAKVLAFPSSMKAAHLKSRTEEDTRVLRRSELDEGASAEALVFDAATRMFWRNLRARAGPAPVRPLGADPVAYDLPAAAALGAIAARLPEVAARLSCTSY